MENDYFNKLYFAPEYNLWDEQECIKRKRSIQTNCEQPMFSFMMCTYNDVSLLNASINSLLTQSCQDWELVILDNSDKSDKPWELIANAMKLDSRIHGYKSDQNYGWAKGASILMKYIKGKYTTFLAADDLINNGALELMHEILKQKQPDILWVNVLAILQQENQAIVCDHSNAAYHEYDDTNHSQNIVDIMNTVYYNSFFHYMNVDFLRRHNIDFFNPYQGDVTSMTKALTVAKSMITTPAMVYNLTMNTSQTRGHYIWNSYNATYATQWKLIKQIFCAEHYTDRQCINYVASRIIGNMINSITPMLEYRCRNEYMNPITKNIDDILCQLEDIFENEDIQEMLVLCDSDKQQDIYNAICNFLMSTDDSYFYSKPMLSVLKTLFHSINAQDYEQQLKSILTLICTPENKRFIGFIHLSQVLEKCSDDIVNNNYNYLTNALEQYSLFLEETNKTDEQIWFINIIN